MPTSEEADDTSSWYIVKINTSIEMNYDWKWCKNTMKKFIQKNPKIIYAHIYSVLCTSHS